MVTTGAPTASSERAPRVSKHTRPSETMFTALQGARPWVMTVALTWLLPGLLLMVLGVNGLRTWHTGAPDARANAVAMIALGVMVFAAGVQAWGHVGGLLGLREGRTNAGVERALRSEARFWTAVGAVAVFLVLVAAAGLVVAVAAFFLRGRS